MGTPNTRSNIERIQSSYLKCYEFAEPDLRCRLLNPHVVALFASEGCSQTCRERT